MDKPFSCLKDLIKSETSSEPVTANKTVRDMFSSNKGYDYTPPAYLELTNSIICQRLEQCVSIKGFVSHKKGSFILFDNTERNVSMLKDYPVTISSQYIRVEYDVILQKSLALIESTINNNVTVFIPHESESAILAFVYKGALDDTDRIVNDKNHTSLTTSIPVKCRNNKRVFKMLTKRKQAHAKPTYNLDKWR
jgi:hypothetical protein